MRSIGYVLKRYPRLSETFILQEILGLERLGVPLHVFAIMDPREPIVHPEVAQVRAKVEYLSTGFWSDLARIADCHARLFVRSPARYVAVLLRTFVIRSKPFWSLRATIKHFLQAGVLAYRAQAQGIDHFHAHFAHNPAKLARVASLLTGIPYSFTTHAKDLYLADPVVLADKIHTARFVVTCTGYNRTHLCRLLEAERPELAQADTQKIHLVYHGVDLSRFRPGRRAEASAIPTILSVGRLVDKKGFPHLVRACGILKAQGRRFECDIYGSGPLRGELLALIGELELDGVVRLRGSRTQDDLVSVYQQADVFALAPRVLQNGDRDGIPNVLLEASASGLPIVTTDVSGIPELVDPERTGLLVPPDDPGALADALGRLLEDDAFRGRLGRAARDRAAARFDAEPAFRTLAALFGYRTPADRPSAAGAKRTVVAGAR